MPDNKNQITELDSVLLLLLRFTKSKGQKNLSKAQINKIIYLLETSSRKYTGLSFFNNLIKYHRDDRGPISVEIKASLEKLISESKINFYIEEKDGYTHQRHSHEINDEKSKLNLLEEKIIFATSTFNILYKKTGKFNQIQLNKLAYATQSMKKLLDEEKTEKNKILGTSIDFDLIPLDSSLLEDND
jgi:hypothetical protein